MVQDDRADALERERLEEPVADLGVGPHDLWLLALEGFGLEEDPVRDPDLADVVEDGAQPDGLDVLRRPTGALGEPARQGRESLAVPVRGGVARLDRVRERGRERGQDTMRSPTSSSLRCERSSADATASWNSPWEKGFITSPSAPRASASESVEYVPAPVTRTTGRLGRGARTSSSSSSPDSPGMITSLTTSLNSGPRGARACSAVGAPTDS